MKVNSLILASWIAITQVVSAITLYPAVCTHKGQPAEEITGSFEVINNTNADMVITTEVSDWIPTAGTRLFKEPQDYPYSIADLIMLEEETFIVNANSRRQIRYCIHLPEDAKGGYWGIVFFSTKPPAAARGMEMVARVSSIVLVEVESPETVKRCEIPQVKVNLTEDGTLTVSAKLKNLSNTFIYPIVKGFCQVYEEDELVCEGEFHFDTRLLLIDEEKEFYLKEPLKLQKDRNYKVVVAFDYGGEKLCGKRFEISTTEPIAEKIIE